MKYKIKLPKTDRIVGISALIISLLTLIMFINQTNMMRRQNTLSVKPRLHFEFQQITQDSTITITELIINKGLGPAIIDSIAFDYGNQTLPFNIENLITSKYPKLLIYGVLIQSSVASKGSTLLPNERFSIYTYEFPTSNLDKIFEYLSETDIADGDSPFPASVIYTSIYEDRLWLATSDSASPVELDD